MHYKSRNPKLLILIALVLATILILVTVTAGLADEPPMRPTPVSPDVNNVTQEAQAPAEADKSAFVASADAAESAPSCVAAFQAGGDRLAALQNNDGGWDWPLDDGDPTSASPLNTVGPIAMGLAQAYLHTGDPAHSATLQDAGSFLLSKTNNFSPSDGYLAAQLDTIFGGSTYVTHVTDNFYGPLAAGAYDRNGAGTLYDAAGYVNLIRTARANQGIANLAAWDIGMGLVGAAAAGADTTAWIAGVKAEIDELDGDAYYDVIGLAGAVYGLAYVGEDYDPTAGEHAAASDLAGLADILAGYQIDGGGFTWNMGYVVSGNETVQETAYSVLALDTFDRSYYFDVIQGAITYLKNVQMGTGGWENYTGYGENNEVTGEALWAISIASPGPVTSNVLATPNPVAVGDASMVTAVVDNSGTGCYDIASAEYSLDNGAWTAMDAADDAFDEFSEDVEAAFTVPAEAGIVDLCVQGTDVAGNTSAAECIMLVVFDPDGGFVTGGGWIESPAGAVAPVAELVWDQGFELDAAGWLNTDDAWYGTVTRVGSGTNGITSSMGAYHAIFEGDGTSAPFSRFDQYRDTWPGTWTAEVDVYLDPSWPTGEGFDYSVAATGSDGNHQRDYIFHVGVVEDYGPVVGKALLVNGSNNADFYTNPYKLVNDNGGNYYTVSTAGWYTLQHVFYDAGGHLDVDLNLIDESGTVIWTATRSNAADTIPGEVGGNRYGWFTHIDVSAGIAVDEHQLVVPVGITGRANFGFVSKYKKGVSVPTGSTEFQFKAGDLNFHSTSYDWLLVTGSDYAKFKGEGTINGAGAYKFQLWAGDSYAGGEDTFRIKIWYEVDDEEFVVYDNGMDQVIGGGNIVVHSKK